MKIVCDENILFAQQFFERKPNGEKNQLILMSGRDICTQDLIDADCLLVRSVTEVSENLLNGTSVKYVGTATIGTDHIDLTYLKNNNISFADAAGSSAKTVAQYVLTAIQECNPEYYIDTIPTIGIVGVGNIGSELLAYVQELGWHVLCCDPYKSSQLDSMGLTHVSLEALVSRSDIISLHVPLTFARECGHPTYHLIEEKLLGKIKPNALLINTARGPVINELDLLSHLKQAKTAVVLDVFEHEPRLDAALVDKLALATPHIAGYSVEGKARGTQMIYDAWCVWMKTTPVKQFNDYLEYNPCHFGKGMDDTQKESFKQKVVKSIPQWYDITQDDKALRQCQNSVKQGECFDQLRKQYKLRREWLV